MDRDGSIGQVKAYYDAAAQQEWKRIENRPEFLFTKRIMSRYIHSGDSVLDIGGGAGRYALWLSEIGCGVTMLELSDECCKLASQKACEMNLPLTVVCGSALDVDALVTDRFDHVLLMGPLYHLPDGRDRESCVRSALSHVRPGGLLWAAFLTLFASINWAVHECPEAIAEEYFAPYLQHVADNRSIGRKAFTDAFFCEPTDALRLMDLFPLEKLHFFNQEGVIGANGNPDAPMNRVSPELLERWLDFSEKLLDMPQYYALANHLMYVGRRRGE